MKTLKIRVVNVVDLMKLQPESEHPHGLNDHDFDALFGRIRIDDHQVGGLQIPVHDAFVMGGLQDFAKLSDNAGDTGSGHPTGFGV